MYELMGIYDLNFVYNPGMLLGVKAIVFFEAGKKNELQKLNSV